MWRPCCCGLWYDILVGSHNRFWNLLPETLIEYELWQIQEVLWQGMRNEPSRCINHQQLTYKRQALDESSHGERRWRSWTETNEERLLAWLQPTSGGRRSEYSLLKFSGYYVHSIASQYQSIVVIALGKPTLYQPVLEFGFVGCAALLSFRMTSYKSD
jgi:hypothetical protein